MWALLFSQALPSLQNNIEERSIFLVANIYFLLTPPSCLTAFSGFPSFSFNNLSSFSYVWLAMLGYLHTSLGWFLFCIKVNSASVLFLFDCTFSSLVPPSVASGDTPRSCVGILETWGFWPECCRTRMVPMSPQGTRVAWPCVKSSLCLDLDIGEHSAILGLGATAWTHLWPWVWTSAGVLYG